jgi:hypothetical protein
MANLALVTTVSDEISNEVAVEILTRQIELERDPRELLMIVQTVHAALRDLAERARERASI